MSNKVRTITISKKELFFELDDLSQKLSESLPQDSLKRVDQIALDTESDNGMREVTRLCDHRVSDLRQLMAKFIQSTTATDANDTLVAGNYVFTLSVSQEVEDNTLNPLADLIHDYIVNGVLADHLSKIGVSANQELLLGRASEAMARIRELIYYRPMPTSSSS